MFKLKIKEYINVKDDFKKAVASFCKDTLQFQDNLKRYEDGKFIASIKQAREEWLAAQNYFQNVSDPDLIDYAIYSIEACKRKYIYLLKQAKIRGVKQDFARMH